MDRPACKQKSGRGVSSGRRVGPSVSEAVCVLGEGGLGGGAVAQAFVHEPHAPRGERALHLFNCKLTWLWHMHGAVSCDVAGVTR